MVPARRSARRATCGCPTRSATTTWSRASRRHPEAARADAGCLSRPRATATCSTPAQGAPAPALHRVDAARDAASSWPSATGSALPDALVEDWPPQLSAADEKGWFRFQRLYDVARSVLRTEDDVRRLVREAAEDDVADGGRWLEIQVDPSGYAARFGGHHRVHRPGPRRRRGRRRAHRARDRGGGRGEPHPAPAGRPHPGPAGRAVRRPRRGRLRALQRRAARHDRRLRAGLRDRRAGRAAAGAARRRAARPGQRPAPAWTTCTRTGSGTASASVEDPALLDRVVAAGACRSRCARSPTSRSASTAT